MVEVSLPKGRTAEVQAERVVPAPPFVIPAQAGISFSSCFLRLYVGIIAQIIIIDIVKIA